jgi:hypothetical protein
MDGRKQGRETEILGDRQSPSAKKSDSSAVIFLYKLKTSIPDSFSNLSVLFPGFRHLKKIVKDCKNYPDGDRGP